MLLRRPKGAVIVPGRALSFQAGQAERNPPGTTRLPGTLQPIPDDSNPAEASR